MGSKDHVLDKGDPTKLFRLLDEIAVGSYGRVYKAQHKQTNEIVALKIVHIESADVIDEFLEEITIMRLLNHPNIVKLVGAWKKGSELYVCGSAADLYQVLEKPVPEPVIAYLVRETLKALDFCHEKAIIHRDVKGANVLMTMEGQVKLTDFGVSARMVNPTDKRKTFIGTPYWLAPEVVLVNSLFRPYDNKRKSTNHRQVDMWSLGITCLELAEMKPPRYGEDPTKAMNEIPRTPPPKIAEAAAWSNAFHDFLALLVSKDPSKRPSCKELLKHEWMTAVADNGAALLVDYIRKVKKLENEFEPPGAPPAAAGPTPPTSPSGPNRSGLNDSGRNSSPFEGRRPSATVSGDQLVRQTSSDAIEPPTRRSNRGETVTSPRAALASASALISSIGKKARSAIGGDEDDDLQISPRGGNDSTSSIPELQKLEREWAEEEQSGRPTNLKITIKKSNQHSHVLMKRLLANQFKELKKVQQAYLKAHEAIQKTYELDKQGNQKIAEDKKAKFTAAEAVLLKSQLLERDQLAREHSEEVKALGRNYELKMAAEKQGEESVQTALYNTGESSNMVVSQMEIIESRGRLLREQYVVEVRQKGEFFDLAERHLDEHQKLTDTHMEQQQKAEYAQLIADQTCERKAQEASQKNQLDYYPLLAQKQKEHHIQLTAIKMKIALEEYREKLKNQEREWWRRSTPTSGSKDMRKTRAQQAQLAEKAFIEQLQASRAKEEEEQNALYGRLLQENEIMAKEVNSQAQKALLQSQLDGQVKLQEAHLTMMVELHTESQRNRRDLLEMRQKTLIGLLDSLHKQEQQQLHDLVSLVQRTARSTVSQINPHAPAGQASEFYYRQESLVSQQADEKKKLQDRLQAVKKEAEFVMQAKDAEMDLMTKTILMHIENQKKKQQLSM